MAKTRHAPQLIACRYCGDTCDRRDRDHYSHWTHHHPPACPYRTDRVPSLNGVHVGDVWRNLHTGDERRVVEIRLGSSEWGCPGWEADVVMEPLDPADDTPDSPYRAMMNDYHLWSLAEHWEPVTRPGEWPVPREPSKRFPGSWSAVDAWRCPGYRGRDYEAGKAYYHAHLASDGGATRGWEWWQIDAAALDPEELPEPADDEQLALLVG